MDKYKVKITPRAALDIDNIYCYIADEFKDIGSAENHAYELEEKPSLAWKQCHTGALIEKPGHLQTKDTDSCL